MAWTRSGGSVPVSTPVSGGPLTCVPMGHSRSPAPNQHIFDPKLIQSARNDEIDQVLHGLGSVVEARSEEENRRTCASRGQHALEVNRREGRLSWHQHELALLLQRHGRGAM